MTVRREAQHEYVERIGRTWEARGLPPIAGRILGYLTLQADPVSLEHLATALQVSKAGGSVGARFLERLALITRVSLRGDRRDYYAIDEQMPARVVALKLGELQELQDAFADLDELAPNGSIVRARIVAFRTFHERLLTQMRSMLLALESERHHADSTGRTP